MATDATGTPTALGIPKYNTTVDAPSGLGFNAAMDTLDTLIANRVLKPAGLASGEVPVWNGTTWVRSTTTNIGPSSLGSGTPDNTKFLRGDGSWQVVSIPTVGYGTALPGSPTDGQEYILVDSLTVPSYQWRFRYNAGSSQADKWEFIGGPPLRAAVNTSESVTSTTYVDAATVVSVTAPRAGQYLLHHGYTETAVGNGVGFCGIKIGAAAATDSMVGPGGTVLQRSVSRVHTPLTFAALDVIKQQYHVNTSGTQTMENRWLTIVPIRVS